MGFGPRPFVRSATNERTLAIDDAFDLLAVVGWNDPIAHSYVDADVAHAQWLVPNGLQHGAPTSVEANHAAGLTNAVNGMPEFVELGRPAQGCFGRVGHRDHDRREYEQFRQRPSAAARSSRGIRRVCACVTRTLETPVLLSQRSASGA